jgi:DNA-binding transcriptional ArsR family regulator
MAKTIYLIKLSEEERCKLQAIIENDKETERARTRAQILLLSDTSIKEKEYTVQELETIIGTTHTTIMTTRETYAKSGLEAAVFRKHRTIPADKQEFRNSVANQILQIRNEIPPDGRKSWSLRMLCLEAEKRGIVEKISRTTLMRMMKEIEQ